MTFGEKLKALREDHKLTQHDLSNKINISQPTIHAYERNLKMPRPEVVVNIARVFNVTTDYLLGIFDIYDQKERLDQMARSNPLLSDEDKLNFVKSLSENEAKDLLEELKKRFPSTDIS